MKCFKTFKMNKSVCLAKLRQRYDETLNNFLLTNMR